jgi:hypothetical protein
MRASSGTGSPSEQKQDWQEARGWYAKSTDAWAKFTEPGALTGTDAKKRTDAAAELARCDAMLAQLP